MSHERQLADVASVDEFWGTATVEMFKEDWSTKDQADFYGQALADTVVADEMGLDALHSLSATMNALEKEAIEKSASDIENLGDADYFEAVARRIGNQSTKAALETVKSERHVRLQRIRAEYRSLPGMGMSEGKDYLLH